MTEQSARKPSFGPSIVSEWRTPQLVRDMKKQRPGVPENTCIVPDLMMIPLLLGKLHGEIHEVGEDPVDTDEYADVHDLLQAIVRKTGHDWDFVVLHARQQFKFKAFHVPVRPEPDPELEDEYMDFSMARYEATQKLIYELHAFTEVLAQRLGDVGSPVRILAVLLTIGELYGIDFEKITAASAAKSARYGGFDGGNFWWDTNHAD